MTPRWLSVLQQASLICFLGFGYDKTNLERIGVSEIDFKTKKVYGTALGLEEREKRDITSMFKNQIRLGTSEENSLLFLRRTVPLG